MDLTDSYTQAIHPDVQQRYDWCEVRNAASVIAHTNPDEFADLEAVLRDFALDVNRDIIPPGGNQSQTAALLNSAFRDLGWREASYSVRVISEMILKASKKHGLDKQELTTETASASYWIDNVKSRVALDVEWHAKDGNLDRDLAAYRALYDAAIIDGAVMITMHREPLRAWALELDPLTTKFNTSTTTNLSKLTPRLVRGDGGGCPVLVVAINRTTV